MRKNKGITLVALVVTIVVLLILAAVSINLVLGENGLISNAKEAREKSKDATEEESQLVNGTIPDYIAEQVNGTSGGNGNGGGGTTLPTTEATKPYMPGDNFTVVSGTTLDNGLTIQDATENGNEYVWVEVPKTTTVYPNAGLNITEFTQEEYTKIENDLNNYSSVYKLKSHSDEYYSDSENGWFINENQYNEAKEKMLKSVYTNGGFWVARYEAGIDKNRTSNTTPTDIPKSKEGLYPYVYVSRTQAKKLAEQVQYKNDNTTYTGSLLFEVQWNLILKFVQNKGKISEDILKKDSTTIGNCNNATFKIERGQYSTFSNLNISNVWNLYTVPTNGYVDSNCIKLEQSSDGTGTILTTGATERNKVMNIYDLEGNVEEWGLGYSNNNNSKWPSCNRGGSCVSSGTDRTAASGGGSINGASYAHVGFRICLI